MTSSIIAAACFMVVLGGLLAIVLAIANRKLHVHEDPRIDDVEDMLPHANCGACGMPGCRSFAEAVVKGDLAPSKCSVNSPQGNQSIAEFLGVAMGEEVKKVARLACAGGSHVAKMRARYEGMSSCRAASVAGGGKACAWGCLGLGDCERACGFNAIHMNEVGLPVVSESACVACNDCVEVCPLDLFSLQPINHKLWVACKNLAEGERALQDCEVACTGCARCATDAPEGLIKIVNNLAVVDYSKNALASRIAIERCPTGAIVWLEGDRVIKGAAAKKIVRKRSLPIEEN